MKYKMVLPKGTIPDKEHVIAGFQKILIGAVQAKTALIIDIEVSIETPDNEPTVMGIGPSDDKSKSEFTYILANIKIAVKSILAMKLWKDT